jgi:hypothetical protein
MMSVTTTASAAKQEAVHNGTARRFLDRHVASLLAMTAFSF